MKAQYSIQQIAMLIRRHKSIIIRQVRRNAGSRGYGPKQAGALLRLQCSPEQLGSRLVVSQETLDQYVYAVRPMAVNCGRTCLLIRKKEGAMSIGRTAKHRYPTADPALSFLRTW